jgi:SAM-dependent methyltransferase
MDVDAIKARQAEMWGKGDYSVLSGLLRPAAVALCDACAVSAGQEVLDVAAGDGNFALACAAEGASVIASDLAPGMVARGRARAEAEGFDVEWVEADAEELPFEADRFDCVGSVFGAMIAPRPRRVAEELFRVARPGNTVGMTAWTTGSFTSELFELMRGYDPPPTGMHLPEEWGDEDTVRERFDGLAGTLELERRTLPWEAGSPQELVQAFGASAPRQAQLREQLGAERFEQMATGVLELVRRWNGGDGPVSIDAEYLLIVARRRG